MPARKRADAVLLSGGNPQIAKGDGDEPVRAYVAALPGWKHDVGKRIDELVAQAVPRARKAVRWNTPFYGVEGQGWFLAMHCFTKYVKVSFLNGATLDPLPPVPSKQPSVRSIHIGEDDPIDERLFRRWIKQAASMPGEEIF